ncbi:acyl carrier protein [Streptomyces xiamenensis]|uniref:acyl carrier protein n=1 Tax=Streptomyces xiamenensis TaxID=408015 RepID=UPI0036ED6F07
MPVPEWESSAPDFHDRLTEAFREALDLPSDTDVTSLVYGEHDHWDSLGHVQLVIALETMFDVKLSGSEVVELKSYDTAAAVVRSHGPALS